MRLSTILSVCLAGFTFAVDWEYFVDNDGLCHDWNQLIRPCIPVMQNLTGGHAVTLLWPMSEAVHKFKQTPEFAALAGDGLCDLVRYHTVAGIYTTETIAEGGPFLQTMLGYEPGRSPGQVLQVEKLSDDRRGRGINFYSGLRHKSTIFFGDENAIDGAWIHAIDTVLTMPLSMSDTALAAGLTSAMGAATKANVDWWTDDEATYFIPNNEAFRRVASTVEDVTAHKLRDIISYHYINSTVPVSTIAMNDANYTTAQGTDVQLTHNSGANSFFVNDAEIVQHNIIVKNGVMHIIDNVLNPDNAGSENSSPFAVSAYPNAVASNKAPFADMITRHSTHKLEAGTDKVRVPARV